MKTISIIKYVFLIAGLGMLMGAYYWYNSTSSFLENAVKTEGTVVDLQIRRSNDGNTFAPVVIFKTYNGQDVQFVSSTASYPASYTKGEEVDVLYLRSNPYDAEINGFFSLWGGVVIVGGLGLIFFLVGGGIILYQHVQQKEDDYLIEQGYPIQTGFQSVELNTNLKVNGRHPHQVITQWQDPSTSKIHVFESNNIWYDPTEYIDRKSIRVYIERGNPAKYHMDISFLPKMED